jgi:very-short-patch-repair endonuclease
MRASQQARDPQTRSHGHAPTEVNRERRKAWWARISEEERQRLLAGFVAAGKKHCKRNAKTRIEARVAEMLEYLGIPFEQNFQIGRFNVDFLLGERIIVECYGDYWHCNPALFQPDQMNRSLHLTAEQKWKKDAARAMALREQGFQYLSFWESDIKTDPSTVRQYLTAVVEEITRK